MTRSPTGALHGLEDVIRYEAFGDHRSGAEADHATARWIADRLARTGMDVSLHPFPLDVFTLESAAVTIEECGFGAFPLWPAAAFSLEGALRDANSTDIAEHIAVVALPYSANATLASPAYAAPLHVAAARGPRAIVAITEGPTNEIIALNADLHEPRATPTLLVSGRDGEKLCAAAREKRTARLELCGEARRGEACNIIARRSGAGGSIVVSTPISGWFQCAGERGAGIAIFLSLAAWAQAALPNPLVFVATSGHEFEGLGSHHVFEQAMPSPPDTALWLHLGANLASYDVRIENGAPISTGAISSTRYAGAAAHLIADVARVFAGQSGYERPFDLGGRQAPGDVAFYRDRGYANLVGLVGATPLHHTRLDTAAFVSPQALTDITSALTRLLRVAAGAAPL